jgi:choline dehydrogenase
MTDHLNPSIHGVTGNLSLTTSWNTHPLNGLLMEATTELTDEFPFLLDMNSGRPIGLGE